MKKILVTLLMGLGIFTLVGCGSAENINVEDTNNNVIEEVVEIEMDTKEYYNRKDELYSKFEEMSSEELYTIINNEQIAEEELEELLNLTVDYLYNDRVKRAVEEKDDEKINELKENKSTIKEDIREKKFNAYLRDLEGLAEKKAEEENPTETYPESRPNIEESKPVENKESVKETKKESPELVQVIKDSEAYTWIIYDAINGKGDLYQVVDICNEMMSRLESITIDDCEFEGEYQAVQNLNQAYFDLSCAVMPAAYNGIDTSTDMAVSYNKVNNETLFLMNELNN